MSTILVFADWFFPGFKAGGPIRSLQRLMSALSDEHRFYLVTRDRDLGDRKSYEGIPIDQWLEQEGLHIWYASPRSLNMRSLLQRVREVRPDLLYLNSFFSRITIRLLFLRRFGALDGFPLVLAPRGEFSPGALRLKSLKKRTYLVAAKRTGLLNGVLWHCTSEEEVENVRARMGEILYHVASDLPEYHRELPERTAPSKREGSAHFVFLSRIHPMKNPLFVLDRLRNLSGEVVFDLFGPIGSETYASRIRQASTSLPSNIRMAIRGVVQPESVLSVLSGYHFFVLPTLGENYGHAIAEALWAGCPVLISDRTPWKNLEIEGAGWTLPLEHPDLWERTLEECVLMSRDEFEARSVAARNYMQRQASDPALLEENRRLFSRVLGETA